LRRKNSRSASSNRSSTRVITSVQTTTLKTLFEIKKGIENLAIFLINIEIATRRWILSDLNKEIHENKTKGIRESQLYSDFTEDQAKITLDLKRFRSDRGQFERALEKEYQGKRVRFCLYCYIVS
jgi:hypothetical protein